MPYVHSKWTVYLLGVVVILYRLGPEGGEAGPRANTSRGKRQSDSTCIYGPYQL